LEVSKRKLDRVKNEVEEKEMIKDECLMRRRSAETNNGSKVVVVMKNATKSGSDDEDGKVELPKWASEGSTFLLWQRVECKGR